MSERMDLPTHSVHRIRPLLTRCGVTRWEADDSGYFDDNGSVKRAWMVRWWVEGCSDYGEFGSWLVDVGAPHAYARAWASVVVALRGHLSRCQTHGAA